MEAAALLDTSPFIVFGRGEGSFGAQNTGHDSIRMN